ncbi:hypothetical protein KLP42_25155 [Rhizobium sp. CSW-27]|nr:hypothetical protein [Rhizobium sp. CSW-27]MBT9373209.1 hypothetical protein [Rhizobium sp. CSW-27]
MIVLYKGARCLLAAAALTAAAGCQYNAKPMPVATYNIYSSYGDKLAGKYLLYVDGSALNKPIKPSDFNCSAHTYPLDVNSSFGNSVRKTMSNLVSEMEVVNTPVDRGELRARGARGIIIVRGESLDGRLRVVPGFWSAGIETEVEISASIVVDGVNGRLLGATVSGSGRGQSDAGFMCEGGSKSMTDSAEAALKQVLGRLGEALVNSDRVRTGVSR